MGIFTEKKQVAVTDPISPEYYRDSKIEPIDVIEDWDLGFHLGSVIKYIKRCGKKPGNSEIQDLKKIRWYVDRQIKKLEEVKEND